MAVAESLYDFFEIASLSSAATFVDFVYILLQIGVGMWITMFIVKCLFMACTVGYRSFY